MTTRGVSSVLVCVLSLLALGGERLVVGAPGGQPEALARGPTEAAFLQVPLTFEVNRGQTAAQVTHLSRGLGYTLFLSPGEAVLVLRRDQQTRRDAGGPQQLGTVVRMRLVGANPAPRVEGLEPLPGKANYFIGNDPTKWRTNIPAYAKVTYQAVYPGVDLVYYGTNQRQLEYDFVVAPGANPKAIRLAFTGVDRLSLDAQGNLLLHMADGEVLQRAPKVYQEIDGARQAVAGRYVLHGKDQVGFRVASYDRARPLVIDPTLSLSYSTYLGGSGLDQGLAITVDSSGHAYVTGATRSLDFPGTAPGSFSGGSDDAFVAKLDPTGSTLLYATYLGGSSSERGAGIAVDAAGNAYVTGRTDSLDFPTHNPYQGASGGSSDAFVAKLDPTGSALLYSTYLGGLLFDEGNAIAVDAAGNAYVTGRTRSFNFPTFNFYQGALNGGFDAFVAKLDPTQAGTPSLLYSTYLGGSGSDSGSGIAVDATGNAYVTGTTFSTPASPPPFPTTANALTSPSPGVNDGTGGDAFVAKLDPTQAGTPSLLYSTYLGGSGSDSGSGIAVNAAGNAYVAGSTSSTNFPTTSATAFQTVNGGLQDAFVAKLQILPASSTLLYSTYLGGGSNDFGFGVAVDAAGNAYVTGQTFSLNFPLVNALTSPSVGVNDGTDGDAFVAKLDPTQTGAASLVYSTYLGGNDLDQSFAIAVDKPSGDAYVTGQTFSLNFPLVNALTSPSVGVNDGTGSDAFVAKLSFSSAGGGGGGPGEGAAGCNMVGHVHGNQNYKATDDSGKTVNVHVEADGDCDFDKQTNMVFLHHAKVHIVVDGGPPLINAKQNDNGKHSDVKSVTLSPGPPPATGTPTAVIEGVYNGTSFKVTLADGGKGKTDDTVVVMMPSLPAPITGSTPRNNVHIDWH